MFLYYCLDIVWLYLWFMIVFFYHNYSVLPWNIKIDLFHFCKVYTEHLELGAPCNNIVRRSFIETSVLFWAESNDRGGKSALKSSQLNQNSSIDLKETCDTPHYILNKCRSRKRNNMGVLLQVWCIWILSFRPTVSSCGNEGNIMLCINSEKTKKYINVEVGKIKSCWYILSGYHVISWKVGLT